MEHVAKDAVSRHGGNESELELSRNSCGRRLERVSGDNGAAAAAAPESGEVGFEGVNGREWRAGSEVREERKAVIGEMTELETAPHEMSTEGARREGAEVLEVKFCGIKMDMAVVVPEDVLTGNGRSWSMCAGGRGTGLEEGEEVSRSADGSRRKVPRHLCARVATVTGDVGMLTKECGVQSAAGLGLSWVETARAADACGEEKLEERLEYPMRGLQGVMARLKETIGSMAAELQGTGREDRQDVSGERDEGQWRDRQHRRHVVGARGVHSWWQTTTKRARET
ncbi:hypothetical protein GY45DRAFT_1341310 [Cubamyces sp. BRFM 1775]|nr:hypothetical protein GY45DRAFT_1341310 [Cubamyces sp. BRFM 1775]